METEGRLEGFNILGNKLSVSIQNAEYIISMQSFPGHGYAKIIFNWQDILIIVTGKRNMSRTEVHFHTRAGSLTPDLTEGFISSPLGLRQQPDISAVSLTL